MKGAFVATYHFTPRSGKFPPPSHRLIELNGWLDQEGEEVDIRVNNALEEGVWCSGVIERSTSVHFKVGSSVNILPDTSTFLLEHE